MTLGELVNNHYDQLNENDKYIWQYIYHHAEDCQKMSIQELAHACNVSHTSILRFTKKIGLDGYSELKVHLKWSLKKEVSFSHQDMHKVVSELKETLDIMETRDLDRVLQLIDESQRIYIYSTGEVQFHAAQELNHEFAYRYKIMHVIDGDAELDIVLNQVKPQDLFLLMSLSGDNDTLITLVKFLEKMQIQTIGIAQNNNNLLSQHVNEFIGFRASHFHIDFHEKNYYCNSHFFLIVNMLFLRYIEYCSLKEE